MLGLFRKKHELHLEVREDRKDFYSVLFALHKRVGLGDLTRLEVDADNIAELLDERTRSVPDFDPRTCFAKFLATLESYGQPYTYSARVWPWPDSDRICQLTITVFREHDRIILEPLDRRVRRIRPLQMDGYLSASSVERWMMQTGRRRACVARDQMSECVHPSARTDPRFDAGACFDAAVAWLSHRSDESFLCGPARLPLEPELLIYADGRHIFTRVRPRLVPRLLWRVYAGMVKAKSRTRALRRR
jgi:hypothetical protein